MYRIVFVFACLSLLSCKDAAKKEKTATLEEQLTGEWNNISMNVKIETKDNTDSTESLEVLAGEWEQTLKIRPIRTFFRDDSTWNSAHYNLNDSLVYNPTGKWWINEGKLIMLQQFPSPDTTSYIIKLMNDSCMFEALVDWDMDGKKDDYYLGLQKKVDRK